jgi:hypothetical protein
LTEFIGPVVANKVHGARLEWDVFIADTNVRSLRELGGFLGPSVWKEAVRVVFKDCFLGKRAV